MSLTSTLRQFIANSDGNVAIISAFAILPMLVLAGGATDIARHEAYRAQLQDGVDRAVLAAASLTQKRPVEDTVKDYLKTLPFASEVSLKFDHTTSTNQREVSVEATYEMETAFLPLIGINTIGVNASATAIQRRQNIEISLILDVSGSMRDGGTPNRITRLKPAATGFIDAVLTEESAPYTSVSLVPYAGSVNPGALVMDAMGVPRRHNNSSCIEFVASDYSAGLVPFNQRTQVPHFTSNHHNVTYPGLEWSWCPYEATSITYLSNNASDLKSKINALKMHDGTGTAIAMKWGMLLLEPAAQPLVALGASHGYVPARFANRPAAFNDQDTLKFIVLMTDGEISEQYRPLDYFHPPSQEPRKPPKSPATHTIVESKATTLAQMNAVCNRAKQNGVVVFTIGFEAGPTSAGQMRACASSPSHFFQVTGLDINTAFQSIATAIQKIRLTN